MPERSRRVLHLDAARGAPATGRAAWSLVLVLAVLLAACSPPAQVPIKPSGQGAPAASGAASAPAASTAKVRCAYTAESASELVL